MSHELTLREDLRCDRCGRFGAYDVGDERLCAECYQLRGSCCPEFGGDDHWESAEAARESEPRIPPERSPESKPP